MKYLIAISILIFNCNIYAQTDTLKVLILSPYSIQISDACSEQFASRNDTVIKSRGNISESIMRDKSEHIEEYNKQPEYTKLMFENNLSFVDSLTLSNYVSYITRDYISHRLFRPYKIKQRIILVTTDKLKSDMDEYKSAADKQNYDFILNFPLLKIFEDSGIKVKATTELYSNRKHKIVYKKESVGAIQDDITDYPMCLPGTIECALVNSVYENIVACIMAIVDEWKK